MTAAFTLGDANGFGPNGHDRMKPRRKLARRAPARTLPRRAIGQAEVVALVGNRMRAAIAGR